MAGRVVTTSYLQSILVGLGHDAAKVSTLIESVVNPPVPAGALKVGNPTHNNSPAVQAAQSAAGKAVVDMALPAVANVIATAIPSIAPTVQAIEKTVLPAAEEIASKVAGSLSPMFAELIAAIKKV